MLRRLSTACATGYRPHQIVALGEPGAQSVGAPILEGRGRIDGRATAYVCVGLVCQRPGTEPEALKELVAMGLRNNREQPSLQLQRSQLRGQPRQPGT